MVEPLVGERYSGESSKAIQACNAWLRLGGGRSLPKLLERWAEPEDAPPTESLSTLKKWSSRYEWATRAEAYDAEIEARKTIERNHVLKNGLALEFERIKKLMTLADFLEQQICEKNEAGSHINVWLPDVKSIRDDEKFERVDIVRFNSALFTQYRGVLEDIAAEMGDRKQKVEHTGEKGGPIRFVEAILDSAVVAAADDSSNDGEKS